MPNYPGSPRTETTVTTQVLDPYWKMRQLERFGQVAREVAQGLDRRRISKAMGALERVRSGEIEWDSAEVDILINKVRDPETKDYLRKSLAGIKETEVPVIQGETLVEDSNKAIGQAAEMAGLLKQLNALHLPAQFGVPGAAEMFGQTQKMLLEMGSSAPAMATFAARQDPAGVLAGQRKVGKAYPMAGAYLDDLMGEAAKTGGHGDRARITTREQKRRGKNTTRQLENRRTAEYYTIEDVYKQSGLEGDELAAAVKNYYEVKGDIVPSKTELAADATRNRRLDVSQEAERGRNARSKAGDKGDKSEKKAKKYGLPKKVSEEIDDVIDRLRGSPGDWEKMRAALEARYAELRNDGWSATDATHELLEDMDEFYE